MVEIKGVRGSKESSQPLIIGVTTVYVHSNIHKVEGAEDEYEYDEIQYTLEEWEDVKQDYYDKQNVRALTDQVVGLESALCDIYELLLANGGK